MATTDGTNAEIVMYGDIYDQQSTDWGLASQLKVRSFSCLISWQNWNRALTARKFADAQRIAKLLAGFIKQLKDAL